MENISISSSHDLLFNTLLTFFHLLDKQLHVKIVSLWLPGHVCSAVARVEPRRMCTVSYKQRRLQRIVPRDSTIACAKRKRLRCATTCVRSRLTPRFQQRARKRTSTSVRYNALMCTGPYYFYFNVFLQLFRGVVIIFFATHNQDYFYQFSEQKLGLIHEIETLHNE